MNNEQIQQMNNILKGLYSLKPNKDKATVAKKSLQIKKDTKREQVFTFSVFNSKTDRFDTITVETNFLDDFDNFGITVTHDTWLPENEGKIMYGVFDSEGGTYDDFEVYINLEDDFIIDYIALVMEFTLDTLYGKNGLINKYEYVIDENGKLVE